MCILYSCYDLKCVKVCAKILPLDYLQQMAFSATDNSTLMSGRSIDCYTIRIQMVYAFDALCAINLPINHILMEK